MANDIAGALMAFSGAIVAQNTQQPIPKNNIPVTDANALNEGLLGLTYDVGTAPVSYAKGPTKIAPVQALNSYQNEPSQQPEV